jgi:hypothetical protein
MNKNVYKIFMNIIYRGLLSNEYQGLFLWGQSGRGVKVTTHLHLVPRSRIHGAIPPLPQHAFICGAHLNFRDDFTFIFYYIVDYSEDLSVDGLRIGTSGGLL